MGSILHTHLHKKKDRKGMKCIYNGCALCVIGPYFYAIQFNVDFLKIMYINICFDFLQSPFATTTNQLYASLDYTFIFDF
mmetsp:Transcript_31770/g.46319  ORF Transcript_31770/g.46319 Transcript_31770/m.46319 type:complete len:80 (-) Transcript_31770:77-316(-)